LAAPAEPLEQTLAGALVLATDTRRVVVACGALDAVADVFAATFGQRPAVVIADETTYDVAGRATERRLRDAGLDIVDPYVFPAAHGGAALHADYEHAARLGAALARHDAIPVAAGAGTINDLAKLGAHLAERPYMVVATAASVDGYAAFGAAITRDGYKQTIACPAPRAIVADVDVLAAAPAEMTASGFGDLLGKITAGADWLVAGALEVEPVDAAAWAMVQPAARRAIAAPERLRGRDPEAVEGLFRCLTMSGLAMQAARSSRPASGAEHQFSHLWEMRGLRAHGADVSHGFKVGVGTVAVAALYERLLGLDLDRLDVEARCAGWPSLEQVEEQVRNAHADPQLRDQALVESRAKYVTAEHLRDRLHRLRAVWPALRERLRAQLLTVSEVRHLLRAAGCPSEPEEIGLARAALRASFGAARQIRRRYTVLDLAAEAGVLDASLDALFGPGGALAAEPGAAAGAAPASTAAGFRAPSRAATAAPAAARSAKSIEG
jgi:glycerol-1-phosphate dehydrogenase [NAD(P)+]